MINRAITVLLARAAIRPFQAVGIATDSYQTQGTCLIGLSKPYYKFGTLKQEILHKIVAKALPDATVIMFRGPKGDEFIK